MRVVELTAYQARIPLRRPVRHASHARTETDNLVVRCQLDDGTEGYGEGVPRDYVTGESIDTALDLLRRSDLASQLEDCPNFPSAVAVAERLCLAPVPGDDRGCQGNAARCAVELALLDAYGRRFKEPLSRAVALAAPDLYEPRDRVRYSGVILSAAGGFKLLKASLAIRFYRFRQVKVKVGIAGQDDPARLKTIRRLLRKSVEIRVDANEAWTADEAAARIQALEPFGIASVEQPVAHEQVGQLRAIRTQVRTPIMLDESLCSLTDAERAANDGICDLFNLRLSKNGGLLPTLRLMQFAKARGLGCQLGCQVGETALLSAAGRHVAASVGGLRAAEGSFDRHLVREALGTRDITFRWGGWAPALTAPGLGVDIRPSALERVAVRKEALLG